MSEDIDRESSETQIVEIDELRRKIEECKNALEYNGNIERIAVGAIIIFTTLSIASASLVLTPFLLAPIIVHVVASVIFGGIAAFGFVCLHQGTKADNEWKQELSELRDRRKYARIKLEQSTDNNWSAVLWSYHAEVASTIDEYRSSARKYRTIHNRFQFFIIIASSLVTLMVTASTSIPGLEWGAAILSFLVASATGITGYFKYRERAVNLQRTADELEREFNSVEIGINDYSRDGEESSVKQLRIFAERAEEIKNEQRKREQQLEQSPEPRSGARGNASQ